MTRQQKSRPESPVAAGGEILAPVRAGGNLTEAVVTRLRDEISSGRLKPGARLPTEQEMVGAMKVSRTVVREAVAALKAQGLVTTRQGSGAFVATASAPRSFRLDPDLLRSIDAVVDVLELRLAVETEAAALAATRAGAAGVRLIRAAHAAFERAVGRDEPGADEDLAFHVAIADATGNAQFPEFLRFLGRVVIPRHDRRIWTMTIDRKADYLARIKGEHARIVEAIAAGDAEAARQAMRAHLTGAAARYRKFAAPAKAGEAA